VTAARRGTPGLDPTVDRLVTDLVSAGAGSGLETDRSDYVAGVQYQPNARLRFGARARFDESDFSLQRLETQGAAFFGRASGSLTYTYLRRQPEIDIPESRQEVVGALSLNATDNLRAFGALRYDIGNAALVGLGAGIAYDDDCFSVSLAYTKTRDDYTDLTEDQRIMLRVELRTLGDGQFSTGREETVSQTP
jgi:LPS-assembly protein